MLRDLNIYKKLGQNIKFQILNPLVLSFSSVFELGLSFNNTRNHGYYLEWKWTMKRSLPLSIFESNGFMREIRYCNSILKVCRHVKQLAQSVVSFAIEVLPANQLGPIIFEILQKV
jgi:hypothetical protein